MVGAFRGGACVGGVVGSTGIFALVEKIAEAASDRRLDGAHAVKLLSMRNSHTGMVKTRAGDEGSEGLTSFIYSFNESR